MSIDPGRRPSSCVSSTSGERGSRRNRGLQEDVSSGRSGPTYQATGRALSGPTRRGLGARRVRRPALRPGRRPAAAVVVRSPVRRRRPAPSLLHAWPGRRRRSGRARGPRRPARTGAGARAAPAGASLSRTTSNLAELAVDVVVGLGQQPGRLGLRLRSDLRGPLARAAATTAVSATSRSCSAWAWASSRSASSRPSSTTASRSASSRSAWWSSSGSSSRSSSSSAEQLGAVDQARGRHRHRPGVLDDWVTSSSLSCTSTATPVSLRVLGSAPRRAASRRRGRRRAPGRTRRRRKR